MRRGMISAVVACAAAVLWLGGCMSVPLGDPAKATADSRFYGAWEWVDGRTNVAVVRPWDERTYVVDMMAYTGGLGEATPVYRNVFKGWLTDVKGQTFVTLQPIETLTTFTGEKREKVYPTAKLVIERDRVTATGLDPQFKGFKAVATPTDLARVVGENLGEVSMWVKPIEMRRIPTERIDDLANVTEMFEKPKK